MTQRPRTIDAPRSRPTETDFDDHEREVRDLDAVQSRLESLPVDSVERAFLEARKRQLLRRIAAWLDRFAR